MPEETQVALAIVAVVVVVGGLIWLMRKFLEMDFYE